jgi:hypothetical protein
MEVLFLDSLEGFCLNWNYPQRTEAKNQGAA